MATILAEITTASNTRIAPAVAAFQSPIKAGFLAKRLANMETSYEQAESDANSNLSHKFIVEKAYPAEKKAYPIRWLIVVLSTFSTLLLGITLILIKNRIDQLKNS